MDACSPRALCPFSYSLVQVQFFLWLESDGEKGAIPVQLTLSLSLSPSPSFCFCYSQDIKETFNRCVPTLYPL